MTADLDLDPQQREELARLLGEDSLGALLVDWRRFVSEVERGYEDSIYDYENDLSVRDRLERLVGAASPGLRTQVEGALAEPDRRFTAATKEAARPLGVTFTTWWWRRVPVRLVGELAEDLRSLG
jgi:hypothetical protein